MLLYQVRSGSRKTVGEFPSNWFRAIFIEVKHCVITAVPEEWVKWITAIFDVLKACWLRNSLHTRIRIALKCLRCKAFWEWAFVEIGDSLKRKEKWYIPSTAVMRYLFCQPAFRLYITFYRLTCRNSFTKRTEAYGVYSSFRKTIFGVLSVISLKNKLKFISFAEFVLV